MRKPLTLNLFKLWAFIGSLCFVLMLFHQSRPATFFGRYSNSYSVSLGMMLLTIAMALFGYYLAKQDLLDRFVKASKTAQWLIVLATLSFIFLFWVFMPGATFLPAIALFRIYIVAVVSGLALFYLYQTQAIQTPLPTNTWTILLGIGALLALIVTALYIGKIPSSLYYDEPLVANFGWTCVADGSLGVEMLPPRDTAYMRVTLPLAYCVPGILMQVFGTSLAVARSFGILCLWLAAPFVYFTAKRLYSTGAAAVIAALVMLLFALAHNHLRSDPYVTLVVAIALYGYTRTQEKPALWLNFIVGFFLATIIEGHQLGVRFIPVFTLLYLWQYIRVIREQKRFVFFAPFFAFALGGLAYLPIYYLIHVIWWANTDLSGAIDLLQAGYAEQLTVGGNVSFWERISSNFSAWFLTYGVRHPVEVLLLVIGLISAIWRFERADRLLLFIFALSWLLYIYIAPKPTPYYWVHHLPIIALLAGGFIHGLTEKDRSRIRLYAIYPILVLLVFYIGNILLATQSTQNADRLMEISFDIDEHLPDDLQDITGHQVYFFGLAQRTFYDSNTFSTLSVPEAVDEWHINPPQAIIGTLGLDEHPSLTEYIEAQGMIPIRCYPTQFFSGRTTLYVLPEFADEIEAQACP